MLSNADVPSDCSSSGLANTAASHATTDFCITDSFYAMYSSGSSRLEYHRLYCSCYKRSGIFLAQLPVESTMFQHQSMYWPIGRRSIAIHFKFVFR